MTSKLKRSAKITLAHKLLDEFLKDYRESDGGYAPFTKEDEDKLWEFLNVLREAKFEQDPDGDLPCEFDVTNRTTHERSHFVQVPYSHLITDMNSDTYRDYIRSVSVNADIANQRLSIALRSLIFVPRDSKK